MRTFLAVSPPIHLARELYSARAALREVWEGIRWVKAEHFHITLVFLGEQDHSVIRKVVSAVSSVSDRTEAFRVEFDGIGCFGSPQLPKMLFEKIGEGRSGLKRMNSMLRPFLQNLSAWEHRPYHPHLTLGRAKRRGVRGPAGGGLLPSGAKTDTVGSFPVRNVILYQSILHTDGVEYVPLESWPIKEAL